MMTNVEVPASSLYPVVQDLTEVEYNNNTCCCDAAVADLGQFSLKELCSPVMTPLSVHEEDESPNTKHRKSLLALNPFPSLKRRGSLGKQRGALLDQQSDSQTIVSTEAGETVQQGPPPPPPPRFEELYVLTRQIFRCEWSEIWETIERKTGQRYCVKIFDQRGCYDQRDDSFVQTREDYERLKARQEIELLNAAQGPNIVQLFQVLEEEDRIYVVMEHMAGGNLLSRVVQQEGLDEGTTRNMIKSILKGLLFLHSRGICHNDLHPSNILLDNNAGHNDNVVVVKIADFGSANRLHNSDDDIIMTSPGVNSNSNGSSGGSSSNNSSTNNSAYIAPEVLQGHTASPQADMWSVGVLCYFCLFGRPPFTSCPSPRRENNHDATSTSVRRHHHRMMMIRKSDYLFPPTAWNHVSRTAKQFISGLLHMDPTVRFTAQEALQHVWFDEQHDFGGGGGGGSQYYPRRRRLHQRSADVVSTRLSSWRHFRTLLCNKNRTSNTHSHSAAAATEGDNLTTSTTESTMERSTTLYPKAMTQDPYR